MGMRKLRRGASAERRAWLRTSLRTSLRVSCAAVVVGSLLGVAACGATAPLVSSAGPSAAVPLPDGVATGSKSPAPPLTGCDASLRPTVRCPPPVPCLRARRWRGSSSADT